MDEAELQQILEELDEYAGVPMRPPGCATATEWAEHRGVSPATARRWLGKLVQKGIYERIGPVLDPGISKRVYVWRRVKSE